MVEQDASGQWWVTANGNKAGPFPSNRKAWRALDLMMQEPTSRKEDVTEWSSRHNDT